MLRLSPFFAAVGILLWAGLPVSAGPFLPDGEGIVARDQPSRISAFVCLLLHNCPTSSPAIAPAAAFNVAVDSASTPAVSVVGTGVISCQQLGNCPTTVPAVSVVGTGVVSCQQLGNCPPPTTSSNVVMATPPPPPVHSPTSQGGNGGGGGSGSNGSQASDSDVQQYLSAHNTVRAQHGAAPLTWSNEAAAKAQEWANRCVFKHSGGTLGPFGENLAAGTGDSYDIATAIKSWTDEVSQYNSNNPQPSHFTQVVWKGTTQVGCAVQLCDGIFPANFGKAKFFVCEYTPQGNIIGQFAQNVQA
ncbi:PR-1-like protein [Panus rudis PR-1116 ss-1]|nr:PR-1-like protein [Panus rudis PR-1116 ss-1]